MSNQRIAALKTDEYYWSTMKWWDRGFKNAAYLATLTLGELGALLEYSVHNDMHMRWSSMPRDPDPDPQKHGKPLPEGRADYDLRTKWDQADYDFLGEFYSSHVNPVFWRLHGWVDDRIEDWYRAHEQAHSGQIERTEYGGVQWFKPGKWVLVADPWEGPRESHSDDGGGDMHHHEEGGGKHDNHNGYDIETMEKVAAVLFGKLILDKPAPKEPVVAEKAPADAALLAKMGSTPELVKPLVEPRRTWFSSL